MKLTILIMIVCLMQVSALTNAQITIDAKQESLRNVLKKISQQSGYDFIYSVQDFKNANPVDLKLTNVSIEKALSAAFYGQPLIYEVSDKTVMVKKKEAKFYLETIIDRFRAIDVRGIVIDENNLYLAGATVRVKGGKGTALTSAKGEFFIKNVEEGAVLDISYIGYKPKEVKAIDDVGFVKLELSESKLDEVQVMAYGVTNRRLSTGTIDGISAKEIERQNINNPLLALQARIPGLNISPSNGTPNAAVDIRIRGQNSIVSRRDDGTITTEPLIIVDGVPYENNIRPANQSLGLTSSALSFLNPSDIASIDVLKDADATSIYGSRGANGVILVTTKKGKVGDSRISITASSGFGEVGKKMGLLNTQQYLEMRKEAYKNDGIDFEVEPFNDPAIRNLLAPDLFVWDQNRYTDWQEVLWGGKAKNDQLQASVSGGAPNFQYLFNLGYNHQGYILPGSTNFDNATGRLNITTSTPNQKLRVALNTGYTNNRNKILNALPLVLLPPNAPDVYNENGQLNWEPDPVSGIATWDNPYASSQKPQNSSTTVLNFNVDLQYQITSNLIFKTLVGLSELNGEFTSKHLITSFDPKRIEIEGNTLRRFDYNKNSSTSRSVEPQIQYHGLISKGRLTALIGGTLQYQKTSFSPLIATGFASDAAIGNLAAADDIVGFGQSTNEYKYNAIFGRLSYNWEDKYLVNINVRRDGSSRFGPNRQFGNFGSVAGAWVFTNEPFMTKLNPIVSFGKLRSSYGSSGSDRIGNYKFLENYIIRNAGNSYQGVKTLEVQGVSNPYYSWENVKKLEYGLELGFLSDKLILNTTYFRNRSSNQLGRQFLPMTAGNSANSFIANQTAKIENSGWEFTLNTTNIEKKNFKWSTSINFSYLKNKLLSLPTTGFFIQSSEQDPIGKPFIGLTNLYGYRGIDQSNGLYQFVAFDDDGDGIPENASTYGDPLFKTIYVNPNQFGGFTNSFSVRGFSLDFTFQFTKQLGLKSLYSNPTIPGSFSSVTGNQSTEVLKRWQKQGNITDVQLFTSGSNGDTEQAFQNIKQSDFAYTDASFIRLKNASLSYNFPKHFLTKTKLENLRIYIQGQNLWTITKYKGMDPEILGINSLSTIPQLRVFTAGFQVLF